MQNNFSFKKIKKLWIEASWEKLSNVDLNKYKKHTKRAKIALYLGSAHQHLNHVKIADKYLKKSLEWHISKTFMHQILMSDIYFTLGKIALFQSNLKDARLHIRHSLQDNVKKNISLLVDTRIMSVEAPNKTQLNIKEKTKSTYINKIVTKCLQESDYLDALDKYLLGNDLNDNQKFSLCCLSAERISLTKDRNQGINLINNARLFIDTQEDVAHNQYVQIIEIIAKINQQDLLVDLFIESISFSDLYRNETKEKIIQGYSQIRSVSKKNQQHGHDLLIDYIIQHHSLIEKERKLLLEIGTTRENVPGQGSTQKIAQLCKDKNIKFITIDMDPHNSKWAKLIAKKRNLPMTSITAKGEDYLRDSVTHFDFLFLDAYDFDHGKHSQLRQSRYEKYLGNRIDEEACHIMHLECAYSIEKKLAPDGIICIDDTWQDNLGNWTAKGTLAVPYLLSHGFEIIEARNNAVLMKRITIKKEIN